MGKLIRLDEIAKKYDTTEEKLINFAKTNPQVTFYFADEEILMDFLVDVSTKLVEYMGSPMQINNVENTDAFVKVFEKKKSRKEKEVQNK
jgi:phosphoribosylamine-glycine ligase